jgi:hypothetical protein
MISVCLQAGLANQMFCYAFARGLKAKGLDVYIDQSNFKPRKEWAFEFVRLQDAFPDIDIKPTNEDKFKYSCITGVKGFLLRKLANIFGKEKYIKEPVFGYVPDMEKMATKDCNFIGLWQTEKYFEDCKEDVRKNFTFLPFDEPKNIEVYKKMNSENSIAIHVRKGADYQKFNLYQGICSKEYYDRSIAYMKECVVDPVFYVFTDNHDWVKENIKDIEYTLVDWNPTSNKRNFRDMQLMSCAKHNIIANSTYSWWGAWLNKNPDKIVIAPEPWFNPDVEFYKHNKVASDLWVKIDSVTNK